MKKGHIKRTLQNHILQDLHPSIHPKHLISHHINKVELPENAYQKVIRIPRGTINPNFKRGKLNYYTQFSQTKEPFIKFDLLSMIKSKIHKFYSLSALDLPSTSTSTRSRQSGSRRHSPGLTLSENGWIGWMDVGIIFLSQINCPLQGWRRRSERDQIKFWEQHRLFCFQYAKDSTFHWICEVSFLGNGGNGR